jgi:transcription elongation GreA/GreB family factor/very-short-patch-repair endonuclease
LKNYEEGEEYKTRWEEEGWPFFVKNLENVQGDERDVVFISTTFGRAPGTNRVRQNFGPISRPMGWRRLNVLFTRARRNLHVFSSMHPEDIVVDLGTPEGTKALRNYLEYASRGTLVGADITEREPDSDFEVAVANALREKGYPIQPQLGVAGFFIDIAVRNPDQHGEFLAAIECDGATYHSGVSVRDRDRIRQEILESLGWKGKIWRIWSADWFRNPRNELRRLLGFLDARRAAVAKESIQYVEKVPRTEKVTVPAAEAVTGRMLVEVPPIDEDEDLYVEVGDTVTYCDMSKPQERMRAFITTGESKFDQGIINEAAPLASALLDATAGDEVEILLPGKAPRTLRVLKIERKRKNEVSAA